MSHSSEISDLIRRFIDDRDALAEDEYAQLVAAVRADPELAAQLRDQLLIDDALSQRLAIDRRHFDAQVQQRISDHLRGEDELNQQADELRSLALARLEGGPKEHATSWSTIIAWSAALLILLAAGFGVWSWRQSRQDWLLAKVADVQGQVIIHRVPHNNDQYAEAGQTLQFGDRMTVAEDASVTLAWSDGTQVRLGSGAQISVPETIAGKRLAVNLGNLGASVASQPDSQPMVFATPHANAIVRGTELYLRVQDEETRLEVVSGKVELVEHQTQDVQLVESSQSATATVGVEVAKDTIRWPTSRHGLVYLFSAKRDAPLVRRGSLFSPSELKSQGNLAGFNSQGEIELAGGWFEDALAGVNIAAPLDAAGAMSLEIVLAPAPPEDDRRRTILAFAGRSGAVSSLSQSGNRLQFQAGTGELIEIDAIAEFGKQTHVAVTCAGGQLAAMIDGKPAGKSAFEQPLFAAANRLVLGDADPAASWRGRIAGIAIYDRALQQAEISRNMAGLQKE